MKSAACIRMCQRGHMRHIKGRAINEDWESCRELAAQRARDHLLHLSQRVPPAFRRGRSARSRGTTLHNISLHEHLQHGSWIDDLVRDPRAPDSVERLFQLCIASNRSRHVARTHVVIRPRAMCERERRMKPHRIDLECVLMTAQCREAAVSAYRVTRSRRDPQQAAPTQSAQDEHSHGSRHQRRDDRCRMQG